MIFLLKNNIYFNLSYKIIKSQFEQNKAGWKASFASGFSQDENGAHLPWMTYPFIEYINHKLQSNHEIFEFGSGSSTIFFANKVKKVVAIESNKKWHEIMQIKLSKANIKNVELILMEDALTNLSYENFAKNYGAKFDFVIVDSLKRFECVKNSLSALKERGLMILDDSERKGYKKIFEFMKEKNFERRDFFGIAPGQLKIKNTTLFCER